MCSSWFASAALMDLRPTPSSEPGLTAAGGRRKPTTTNPRTWEKPLRANPHQCMCLFFPKERTLAWKPHGVVAGYAPWPTEPHCANPRALNHQCNPPDPYQFWAKMADFCFCDFSLFVLLRAWEAPEPQIKHGDNWLTPVSLLFLSVSTHIHPTHRDVTIYCIYIYIYIYSPVTFCGSSVSGPEAVAIASLVPTTLSIHKICIWTSPH